MEDQRGILRAMVLQQPSPKTHSEDSWRSPAGCMFDHAWCSLNLTFPDSDVEGRRRLHDLTTKQAVQLNCVVRLLRRGRAVCGQRAQQPAGKDSGGCIK